MSGQTGINGPRFRCDRLNAEIHRLVLTNDEFGRMIDVPEKTVRRWRNGETQPRPRHVRRIAAALGRDPFWFHEPTEDIAA